MAPALSGGGYSSEAIAFAQGLSPLLEKRFKLRQFAEQPDENFFNGLPLSLSRPLMLRTEFPNANPFKGTVVCHSPPDAWRPSKFPGWDELAPCPPPGASFTIGRTMYETDSVPDEWVHRCNRLDSVWVPTEFHRLSFARAGVAEHKLVVVGEPVDADFYDRSKVVTPYTPPPLKQRIGGAAEETREASPPPFRFLSVFKWEQRKGWDALLDAYFREFRPSEPVELWLKTRAFHSSDDFDGLVQGFASERGLPRGRKGRATVRVLGDDLSLEGMRDLYAAADCFVLPSRGEGWGRPHVEAMSMSLPVIATNWSGPVACARAPDQPHTMPAVPATRMLSKHHCAVHVFSPCISRSRLSNNRLPGDTDLDETVGYPLEYTLEPVAAELNLPGHQWAEPSVNHLRQLMRRVYDRRDEAKERGRAARTRMVNEYSPEALAARAVEAVAESKRRVREGESISLRGDGRRRKEEL